MLIGHGWHKVEAFSEIAGKFQEGMGIPPWLTGCAVAAEVIGSALIVIGLATRPAALALVGTMAVAVIKAQAGNPWFTGPAGLAGGLADSLLCDRGCRSGQGTRAAIPHRLHYIGLHRSRLVFSRRKDR